MIRGGWGILMEMAYTNSNALFAKVAASGNGFGAVVSIDNQQGIRNPDGSLYAAGQRWRPWPARIRLTEASR